MMLVFILLLRCTWAFLAHTESPSPAQLLRVANDDWMASLKARQLEINQQEEEQVLRWRKASCSSGNAAVLPDWVRRIDVSYPLMACGSSSGSVFVVDLEDDGEIIASTSAPDDPDEGDVPTDLERTLRMLFGDYDGGGTLAIAMEDTLVCVSGRDGGVHLWGVDVEKKKMVSQGVIPAIEDDLVTCLQIEDDSLWVGTAEGNVLSFPMYEEVPLSLQFEPKQHWNLKAPVMSLHVDRTMRTVVATTSSGSIELMNVDSDRGLPSSFMPPFDSTERRASNAFAQSCTTVHHLDKNNSTAFSVACGGNDGSIYLQPLHLDDMNNIDFQNPFEEALIELSPRHAAPVKCLVSPSRGLIVSGSHDSTLRVWDMNDCAFLYQFVGYKVWLGSLWTDGKRIISDGADNAVVMHDFRSSEVS